MFVDKDRVRLVSMVRINGGGEGGKYVKAV
jgi:hypothetical protein